MVGSAICPAVGQSNRLAVTVVDSSGVPMPDLKADNFTVADRSAHTVSAAVYKQSAVDVVLLIESSAFTNSQKGDIERIAILLVDQLGPKDHMAIFGYSDAPEVMQE